MARATVATHGGATATAGPAGAAETPTGLPHFPALDGLRGVAVAVVVLFHAGFSWMAGGYLGVSTFFTLSGFLITALLLSERSGTGSIDLRRFWRRRFRRLMPAALATLALATVFGLVAADAVQRRNLAGDVTASLLDVANWRFIVSGQAYADLFGAPSPVLHFWSLAIEEQFYLVYPVLAWVALVRLRVSRRTFALLLLAGIAASLAVTLLAGYPIDRIYFGTETRAAEVLVGALLATVLHHRRVTGALARRPGPRNAAAALGAIALAACAVCWVAVPQTSAWLYRGGFTAYALLSAAVLLAAIVPGGPVRALLSAAPLQALGRISYGVYLFHWPVFVWLTPERTGWSDAFLLGPRLAITFALALVSYRLLETPVRQGRRLGGVRPVTLVAPVAAAVVVTATLVTVSAPPPPVDFEQAAAELDSIAALPTAPADDAAASGGGAADGAATTPRPETVVGTPPRPRVAVFGDSTAMMTGVGLYRWAQSGGGIDLVPGGAWLGCGIGRGGERRSGNEEGPIPDTCNQWATTWADKVAGGRPDVAVVQIGPWDVADRLLPGDSTWRAPGDPVYDAYLLDEMTEAVDTLSAGGARVIWLTAPPVGAGNLGDAQQIRGVAADPARTARLNELIAELPARRPGQVDVVDLAGWVASTGEDLRLRPDGVHFGADQAAEVADRWLGPALVEAFDRAWRATEADRLAADDGGQRRVLVLGDPSAAGVADALASFGSSTGLVEVVTVGQPPCGVLATTARRGPAGAAAPPEECGSTAYGWMQSAVAADADVIVAVPSIWDLTDVAFEAGGPIVGPGDPVWSEQARPQLAELTRALGRAAPRVVWVVPPLEGWAGTAAGPAVDDGRIRAYAAVLADALAEVPGADVVDLAELAAAPPGLELVAGGEVDGFTVPESQRAGLGARLGPEVLAPS